MLGIEFESDESVETIIGPETSFKGNFDSEDSVRIEGEFRGTIDCRQTLIIGPEADINADIITERAIIGGRVEGNIVAHDKIEIRNTGEIFGDLTAPVLQIEKGVVLEGSCTINTGGKEADKKVTSIKDKLGGTNK